MKKMILISFIGLTEFCFSQSRQNFVPNYSFENLTDNFSSPPSADWNTQICTNANKPEHDTLNAHLKIITHGAFVRGLGLPSFYTLGYEFALKKNKNTFGIGTGVAFTTQTNFPALRKYLNIYYGIHPFYEFGNYWGFRVGLNIGMDFNPVSYSHKLNYIPNADWPYKNRLLYSLFIGAFYRTKNYRWQFLIEGYSTFIDYHTTWEVFFPFFPGITVKYNFKIRQK